MAIPTNDQIMKRIRGGTSAQKTTPTQGRSIFDDLKEIKPSDVKAGVIKTARDIGSGITGMGQSILRGYGALGQGVFSASESVKSLAEGRGFKPISTTFKPQGTFQKELFGRAPEAKSDEFSLTSEGEQIPGLKGKKTLAPLVGGFLAASDLIPGGSVAKNTAIKILKEVDKADEVAKVLNRVSGIAAKVAEKYAPRIAETTDSASISGLIDTAINESQDVVQMAKRGFEGFKDITTKFLDYAKGKTTLSRQEILDFARRPELKKGEADLLMKKLKEFPSYNKDVRDLTFGDLGKVGTIDKGTAPVISQRYAPQKVTQEIFDAEKTRLKNAGKPFTDKDVAISLSKLEGNIKTSVRNDVKIPAQDFADSIRRDLLELKPVKVKEPQFKRITVDGEGYGVVESGPDAGKPKPRYGKNYEEVVFESPITTNGSSHFPNSKNYFAHARGDEVVEGGKKIWREQEIQSDLLQKETLEKLKTDPFRHALNDDESFGAIAKRLGDGDQIAGNKRIAELNRQELAPLDPFTNDRFGERIMRERIKEKAQKGYSKYRLPTGETIGKIEGFESPRWHDLQNNSKLITKDTLQIGKEISGNPNAPEHQKWIITDLLGDGRFKAVPKDQINKFADEKFGEGYRPVPDNELVNYMTHHGKDVLDNYAETFDLTGKSNPQYRRYEQWGKFLKNKFGGKEVIDPQGNKWVEIDLSAKMADQPVEAFGGFAGFEEDENGNLKFDPKKAGLGIIGMAVAKNAGAFDPKKTPTKEALENAYTKVLTNKDDALKAFDAVNHYDEILNEPRFAKVQEMQMIRDDLADTISNHPGRALAKYANKKTGELPEVLGKGTSQFGRRGDDIVTELGFEDSETARESYQKYLTLKERLVAMEEALKEERPFLRERKALLRTLDKHVVKATEDLPRFATLVKDNESIKDISGFMGGARDVYRNFKAVFGKHYDEVKAAILDPLDAGKKAHIDEQEKQIKELNDNVVKRFGIEKGSKLSEWVMDYGEGKIEADEVVRRYGKDNAHKIFEAADWFRNKYDTMLDEVNTIRKLIYPSNPEKIIPKRPDYFRHFFEMADGFGALKNIFESPAGVAPSLAGLSDFTAPRSKFLSFAQRRLGIKTERDAVGGFLNYLQSYAYAKHIDPHIGKFRRLRKDLVKGLDQQQNLDPKRINNFLEYLSDYANDLAGKTNPADRAMQKYIPGGRKVFNVINWLNRRVKANTILGNVSSSVAQAFNIPQGIASAKQYSIPGAMRTLGGITQNNAPMANSTFIKERYFKGYDQFDKGIIKNTKKFAVWLTSVLDEVGTKFIWNSHYEKALAEKIADPIKYADDLTRELVAGRGIGEVPILQKSKMFQLVAPFQLEVGNLWHVMGDFAKRKDFTAIATLFVANYLMNRVAEEIRGTDVTFDPIQATIEGVNILKDEDDIGQGILKAWGRLAGEVLSNVPLGQTIAGMVPQYGFKVGGFQIPTRKELFGTEGDPTRFGSGLVAAKGLQDPLFKVLPGFGGNQLKKTYEGLKGYFRGAVEDKSGSKMYDVARNLPNLIRSGLFGAYSTPEAREYFDRADTSEARIIKQVKEKAKEKTDQTIQDAENIYRDMKKLPKEEARNAFSELAKENPEIAKAISKIAKEEARGLTQLDRQILSAGVANGARAEIIYKLINKEKTREAKAALWTDLVKKKIITKDVAKQLNTLLKNE